MKGGKPEAEDVGADSRPFCCIVWWSSAASMTRRN